MTISLHEPSLVALMGPAGSGKSTFARRHFRSSEVISSDFCRALVCDNEADQAATADAFDLLHAIVAKRLLWRRTTVVDATNVFAHARRPLIQAALAANTALVAIVFALPEETCCRRNDQRAYRRVSTEIIQQQSAALQAALPCLASEGFSAVFTLSTEEEADTAIVLRGR